MDVLMHQLEDEKKAAQNYIKQWGGLPAKNIKSEWGQKLTWPVHGSKIFTSYLKNVIRKLKLGSNYFVIFRKGA